jgi:hypothetical protein
MASENHDARSGWLLWPFVASNAVRLVVGLLAIAGLVVGGIIAWRSTSATTLLIVSAILLVLAMLGLDWDEIAGTWGGASLKFLRRGLKDVGNDIDEIKSVVSEAAETVDKSEEVPAVIAAVESKLDSVAAKVEALSATPSHRERPKSGSGTSWMDPNEWLREATRTKAIHTFDRSGGHQCESASPCSPGAQRCALSLHRQDADGLRIHGHRRDRHGATIRRG